LCEAPSGPLGQMVPDPFFYGLLQHRICPATINAQAK
jgi:hypothetical protein